jgi:uncharacterized protein involved in exopolysaccharide biosynthesis
MSVSRVSYIKPGETAEFSLFNECLAEVRRRRKLVYGFAGTALILAAVIALFVPHTYTGMAKIMPSLHKSAAPAISAMLPGAAIFSETAGQTGLYLELLKSTTLKNRVLDELGCGPESAQLIMKPATPFSKSAIRQAVTQTDFNADLKSGVVSINTTIADRALGARLANEFVYQLDLRLQELEQGAATRSGGYFAELVAEQESKLKTIETDNAGFLAKNRNYMVSDDPELVQELEHRKFELEFNRQLLLSLLELKANNELEAKKSVPRVVVIEWAQIPPAKSYLSRVKHIILSAAGAALFGIGLIVLQRVYLSYVPQTTRRQLADTYSVLGQDAQVIVRRLQQPLNIRDKAGV